MVEVAEVMGVIPLLTAITADREAEQDQAAPVPLLDLQQVLLDTLVVLILQVHQVLDGVMLELQRLAVVVILDLEGVVLPVPVQHPILDLQWAVQAVLERHIPSEQGLLYFMVGEAEVQVLAVLVLAVVVVAEMVPPLAMIILVVEAVAAPVLVVTVVLVSSSSVIELDKQRINKVPYEFI